MGKNKAKGATQVNGHFFKLHFCMFERSQMKHDSLDCHDFLECLSSIAKLTCSKFDTNQFFLHVQSIQTLKVDYLCFCQIVFLTTKCAPLLLKIGEDFNIDD
jgi:hypothetical protein